MITIEERLRRAARTLDDHLIEAGPTVPSPLPRREAGASRRPAFAIAAAAAVATLAVALVYARPGHDGDRVDTTGPSPVAPGPPIPVELGDDVGGWQRITNSPLGPRSQHLVISTGDGVLIWGGVSWAGVTGGTVHDDGAYLDLTNRTWRTVPGAPLPTDRGGRPFSASPQRYSQVSPCPGNKRRRSRLSSSPSLLASFSPQIPEYRCCSAQFRSC